MCHNSDLEEIEMRHNLRMDSDTIARIALEAPTKAQEAMFDADLDETLRRLQALLISLKCMTQYKHVELWRQLQVGRIYKNSIGPLTNLNNALESLQADCKQEAGR